ncbi:uncharacterized protein MELLADRAFT_85219 [Melampsora larici-populina 98AG31]|uniref:Uncharacterized protein n=1 Tax=Melampsora larici-populina (strain 98AG31 / pathotype 3-4-7) TaxID=747676 RepID=F4RHZ0_MELLP|nr:uncharacterized protein MELLADRAFT_85219 [Melampsora larici-populina 98AG31]EGG07906.1 hypothetical protein MELLADRAFT_85219 [Melampsora larici-populina 98AG31]
MSSRSQQSKTYQRATKSQTSPQQQHSNHNTPSVSGSRASTRSQKRKLTQNQPSSPSPGSTCPQQYKPYQRPIASQPSLPAHHSTHRNTPRSSVSRSTRYQNRHQQRETTEDLKTHDSQRSNPVEENQKNLEGHDGSPQKAAEDSQREDSEEPFNQNDLKLFNAGSDDNNGTDHSAYKPEESSDRDSSEQDEREDNHPSKGVTVRNTSRTMLNNHSRQTAFSSHMTGPQSQSFERIATWADLDQDARTVGRKLCNVTGSEEQFHACMVATLSMRQEMIVLSNQLEEIKRQISKIPRGGGCAWKEQEHTELKAVVRSTALKKIMDGDLQAYTAKENKFINEDPLPFCLYGKVMTDILGKPTEWKKEHLPPRYGVDPDNKSSRAFHSLVNTVLKEVRKDFETVVSHSVMPA